MSIWSSKSSINALKKTSKLPVYAISKVESSRWLEIKLGDRSLQFDTRKTCLKCESVVVDIRRYGRIINKSAIDLMERNFFTKNEDRLEKLHKNFEKVVNKEKNNAPTKTLQAIVEQYSKSKSAAEHIEKDYSRFLENILKFNSPLNPVLRIDCLLCVVIQPKNSVSKQNLKALLRRSQVRGLCFAWSLFIFRYRIMYCLVKRMLIRECVSSNGSLSRQISF